MSNKVSIVIPVKDEKDSYVNRCLESLKKQDYSGNIETLVIKGGNRAQARNFGIQLAKGEIIAFIDSDCIAPHDWLSKLVKHIQCDETLGGVGGMNVSHPNDSSIGKAIDRVFFSYLGSLGSASLYRPSAPKFVDALACINSIFWREILMEIGGFDEEFELNEDTNLGHKIRATGYKLMFVPDSFVWHHRRNSIKQFAQQFFSYGIGRMRSILTNKDYAEIKIVFPFLGALLFPAVLWFFPLFALISVAIYLLVALVFGFKSAHETKEMSFLLLVPALFVIQHFSFLLGMIYGTTKGKWKRKEESCEIFYSSVIEK